MDYEPNNPPILKSKQTNEQGKKHITSQVRNKRASLHTKKKKITDEQQ